MKSLVSFLPFLGLTLAACGSLDANTGTAPTLATLSGSLANPQSITAPGAVRVAVVWRTGTQGQFNVAEDLPVQPVFPSAFTIKFDGPPPANAMNSGTLIGSSSSSSPPSGSSGSASGGTPGSTGSDDPVPPVGDDAGTGPSPGPTPQHKPRNGSASLSFAVGSVVAYVDQNGNGKLDLVATGASAYVDTIVATNAEQAIAYFQGPLPTDGSLNDAFGHLPSDGYNIVTIPDCVEVEPLAGGNANPKCTTGPSQDAGPTCPQTQWFPMSTPYTLTVTSNPEVASLMCLSNSDSSSGPSSSVGSAGGGPVGIANPDGGAPIVTGPPPTPQPAQYPSPCDANLSCALDGSEYFYTTCTTVSEGICEGTVSSCNTAQVTRPSPTPAGWPCQD
jgi:hypothetical protein